ncbi:glycosyltransferase family 4 protein [Rhodovibrio salinarum]|nr:glycosyltransferase family 4 protein [Rhodovibrio salinarum]
MMTQVAFYAPLKPPDHPVPSGDRRMAQLLWQALERAGCSVELASRLRSRDPKGDPARQARLAALGRRLAARYVRRVRTRPPAQRPQVWLTYHLYYKAPDWIGPTAAEMLGIPYLVVEASHAPKRAGGPWDAGHRQVAAALRQAAAVLTINPVDADCLPASVRQVALPPFLDTTEIDAARPDRTTLAAVYGLNPEVPWIIAVAMMRAGDKLASYRELADALGRLGDRRWQMLVLGDGPVRAEVEAAFVPVAEHIRYASVTNSGETLCALASADLFVWPAVNEAYGMALLEAQAVGCPAVCGDFGGVSAILADRETGRLVPPHDPDAFAWAVADLLDDPDTRARMGAAARRKIARQHSINTVSQRIGALLDEVAGRSA